MFSDIFSISSRACLLHSPQSVTTARTATFLHYTDSSRQDFVVRFFTVNIFLQLMDKILLFLHLTTKFLAVLRLMVNPIETLCQQGRFFSVHEVSIMPCSTMFCHLLRVLSLHTSLPLLFQKCLLTFSRPFADFISLGGTMKHTDSILIHFYHGL